MINWQLNQRTQKLKNLRTQKLKNLKTYTYDITLSDRKGIQTNPTP